MLMVKDRSSAGAVGWVVCALAMAAVNGATAGLGFALTLSPMTALSADDLANENLPGEIDAGSRVAL